jgi:hypothetical protein
MARVFIDGFESGSYDLYEDSYSATIIAATAGFDGAYCLELGDSYACVVKNLPGAAEYYFAFRYQPTSGYSNFLIQFMDASSVILGALKGGAGRLTANRGTGTLLATSSTTLMYGIVHRIEVRYKPHATAGVFQVKINGVLEIDFTGNTGTTANIGRFMLGDWANQYNCKGRWDNIVVDDAEWVGDTMIQARMPNGAGNSAQWTPSTGANYACVDEKPPSDADHNKTNVADNLDTLAVAALTGSPGAIKAVAVQFRCKLEGSPPTKIKGVVRTASTDYLGAELSPPFVNAASRQAIWNTNPNTTNPWQPSDAIEIGYKAIA